MSSKPSKCPVKVLLWCTPRGMSTAFLKCMTFVPDTIAWHEPWHQVGKFGKDKADNLAKPMGKLVEMMGGKAAVDQIEGGFDASDTTFEWVKDQLEGEFPGKKLVFVKEIAASVIKRKDTIPRGFRHTFLIRNPMKLVMSFMKMAKKGENRGPFNKEDFSFKEHIQELHPFKDSYELLQYVKENLDENPLIVDADDILENPAGMLEAYCKAVHIPYSKDLLHWEAGDDVMTKHWMVPKETILTFRAVGFHDGTFSSTGFQKPTGQSQDPSASELQLPPIMKEVVDREMPYFEKMYAERLIKL